MKPDLFAVFRAILKARTGKGLTQHEVDQINGVLEGDKPAPPPPHVPDSFPISAIDAQLLKTVSDKPLAELARWVPAIREACRKYEINTIRRVAAFLTYIAHEGAFRVGVRENMNYSAAGLIKTWPTRFRANPAKARALHRKPEAIANEVYANRMGNGPPSSGDGHKFRGNTIGQITGRENHEKFARHLGKTLADTLAYMETLEGGVAAAAWFWGANGLNALADTPGITDETVRINGGKIGIADRLRKFNKLVRELLRRERI